MFRNTHAPSRRQSRRSQSRWLNVATWPGTFICGITFLFAIISALCRSASVITSRPTPALVYWPASARCRKPWPRSPCASLSIYTVFLRHVSLSVLPPPISLLLLPFLFFLACRKQRLRSAGSQLRQPIPGERVRSICVPGRETATALRDSRREALD
jgi:hypothetical protein